MTMLIEKAEVSLPSDGEVKVLRSFKAPAALVYRAYTEPELVRRWMLGPPGWSMPVCEMDVRVGGKFRWRWRSDESGQEFGFHGVFREVKTAERLSHTEIFDPGDVGGEMGEAFVVVDFAENAGATTVTTLIDFGSQAARDGALATGMTDGMEMSYAKLDEMLASGA